MRTGRPWFRRPLARLALIAWACVSVPGVMAHPVDAPVYIATLNGHVHAGVGVFGPFVMRVLRSSLTSGRPSGGGGTGTYFERSWHGFEYERLTGLAAIDRKIGFPYCVIDLLLCTPIVGWFGLLSLDRRVTSAKGPRCRRCGYDLRATPDRCPECGTVPDR